MLASSSGGTSGGGSAAGLVRLVGFRAVASGPVQRDPFGASIRYSKGYHAYWRGDYQAALDELDEAVALDPQDARFWYYKGLAEHAMGRSVWAEVSLGRAVALELAGETDRALVAKALERVQGAAREQLVSARRTALALALKQSRTTAAPQLKIAAGR